MTYLRLAINLFRLAIWAIQFPFEFIVAFVQVFIIKKYTDDYDEATAKCEEITEMHRRYQEKILGI